MNTTLWKDIFSTIRRSKGRFFSIVGLMMLGAFVLVGLTVTGPDMRLTGQHYFQQLHTADLTLIGDKGIDKEDIQVLKKDQALRQLEPGYVKDVTFKGTSESLRLFSKGKKLSFYQVKAGRLPESAAEMALDEKYKGRYQLGDVVHLTEKKDIAGRESLKRHHFRLVGFVRSGEILSDVNQGASLSGTGALKGYGLVSPAAFHSGVYGLVRLSFKNLQGLDPYANLYRDRLEQDKTQLTKRLKEQPRRRLANIQKEAYRKIETYQARLDRGKQTYETKEQALKEARHRLDQGWRQLDQGQSRLAAGLGQAKSELTSSREKLQAGQQLLAQKEAELAAGKETLTKQAQALEQAKANGLEAAGNEGAALEAGTTDPDQSSSKLAALQEQQAILSEKEGQLEEAKSTLGAKEELLKDKAKELSLKQEELSAAEGLYERKASEGRAQLANARATLTAKEAEYQTKKKEWDKQAPKAQQKLVKGQKKLDEVKEKVDHMAWPEYTLYNRREMPGGEAYKIYQSVSNVVDALAKIFPVFLYFVAALVTLTTMTRFVEEERIKSGTLKALGYEDWQVWMKFTFYGLVSSLSGTIIGIVLGHTLLPYIVYNAYRTGFTLPEIEWHFHWKITLVALLLALLSAVLPAYLVGKSELQERPAQLLLPKVPSKGSHILLERIPWLWRRLSFTHKVTARNLFRYKKRMLMTIFGVAGSVAMLYTGYSVQASISDINSRQFRQILRYELIVAKNDYVNETEGKALENALADRAIKEKIAVHYEELFKETGKEKDQQAIKLLVLPKKVSERYIQLQERASGKPLHLSDQGVVISERLAKDLKVKPGDQVTFEDADHQPVNCRVKGITEMYMGHFALTTAKGYRQIFSQDAPLNAYLVQLADRSMGNTEKMAARLMKQKAVKGVVQNTMLMNQVATIVKALNKIMTVLIIIATLLGMVILYNLTTINVAERMRELSTIKVLGFYDEEVTLYIYRETILLTLIGIGCGYVIGELLHHYILEVVPPADVMFDPALAGKSFLIPALIIAVITAILALVIHHHLKEIDMLEALKSVD